MAFKKLTSKLIPAHSMGKKGGKDDNNLPLLHTVEGFLTGVKTLPAKRKDRKDTFIYHFTRKTGERVDVWGCGYANSVCLAEKNVGKLSPEVKDKYVRFDFEGMGKAKKGENAPRIVVVSVDDSQKMPKGLGRLKF